MMFKKGKKAENGPEDGSKVTDQKVSDQNEQTTPAKSPAEGSHPSVISEGMVIKGEVTCPGSLNLEGRMEGSLKAPQVTIGAPGSFSGDMIATSVSLSGEVDGILRCDDLTVTRTARVKGEVTCESLKVHPGAMLEGDLKMNRES